jgi:opacity protein-like surface antigen
LPVTIAVIESLPFQKYFCAEKIYSQFKTYEMKAFKNNNGVNKNAVSGLIIFAATVLMLLATHSSMAQKKWSFEIRPGANFATQKLGGTSLNTGFGVEGSFAYKFMPHLAAYAGWSWNRFPGKTSAGQSSMDYEETGYCFGLQFIHPFDGSKISYMIKGGGTYNHIETENNEGKIVHDTGHGLGWQLGAGVSVPVGKRFQLIPEVRYRSLSRDMKIGETKTSVDLNYISAGVGFTFSF